MFMTSKTLINYKQKLLKQKIQSPTTKLIFKSISKQLLKQLKQPKQPKRCTTKLDRKNLHLKKATVSANSIPVCSNKNHTLKWRSHGVWRGDC